MDKKTKEGQKQEVAMEPTEIKENKIQNKMSNHQMKILVLKMVILEKKGVNKIMQENKLNRILK